MKCPKCSFISFDGLHACKRCGYDFVTKKGGQKTSFFSKLFGGKEEPPPPPPPAAAEEAPAEKEEAPSESEAPAPQAAEAPAPEPEPEPQERGFMHDDGSFDNRFDSLFGEDKEAVKGGDDSIKITATDGMSRGEGDELDGMHDYGFDPFDEEVLPSGGEETPFEKSETDSSEDVALKDDTASVPDEETSADPAAIELMDNSTPESDPAARDAAEHVATAAEASLAEDFMKTFSSKAKDDSE